MEEEKMKKKSDVDKQTTENGVVCLALWCCFASFCFHLFGFAYQYFHNFAREDDPRVPFYLSSNYPIFAGGIALCLKMKTVFLVRRMKQMNLVGAYKPDEDGDLEKGVVGTNFHRGTALDMTMFSFAAWLVGYTITLALQRYVGWLLFMHYYIFQGFMACLFGTSTAMNYRVFTRTCQKIAKTKDQASCCA